jgi:spore maturation protein CgeB
METILEAHNPIQVWLAHSGLVLPVRIKKRIHVPVVGFGFSDPYYFKPTRLKSYDIYVTNHFDTFEKYRHQKKVSWNPTACDTTFHRKIEVSKSIDVSIIGCGRHPRFHNKNERIETIRRLRKDLPNVRIEVFGIRWDKHPLNHSSVTGEAFLSVINRSRLGLDIQDHFSPLAHRMFEYESCGTPVITRDRPEVRAVMNPGEDILTYTDYDNLLEKIVWYLNHPSELEEVGEVGYRRVCSEHDVKNRVDQLEGFLGLK